MLPAIRKISLFHEEVAYDHRPLARPFHHVIAAAVLRNPWLGQGPEADLKPVIDELAPRLGELLAGRALAVMGGADKVEAFGKAAMVGIGGEYEHANALIHTVLFGDPCRRAVGGSAWMVGNQKLATTGAALELPMAHKIDAKDQNFYHTIAITIPDAPMPDELVIAVGMASGPRPNARL